MPEAVDIDLLRGRMPQPMFVFVFRVQQIILHLFFWKCSPQMRTVLDFLIFIWKQESHIRKPRKARDICSSIAIGDFIRLSSTSDESVSFQSDIYPLFEQRCFACHGRMRQICRISG